jgi:hypothetical protein
MQQAIVVIGRSVNVDGACGPEPDLAAGAGAHSDPAHVDHGDGEVGEGGVNDST